MSHAESLVQIAIFSAIAYGVAVVLWHNALWLVSRFTYLNDRGEAAALIAQALTAMGYAAFPAGFVMLITMSVPLALGALVISTLVLWRLMFKDA